MDYALAKELKEAGFPQISGRECICPTDQHTGSQCATAPTLSELIEACGKGFRTLGFHSSGKWDSFMGADVAHEKGISGKNSRHFEGDTPEIAVARLWLALNSPHELI